MSPKTWHMKHFSKSVFDVYFNGDREKSINQGILLYFLYQGTIIEETKKARTLYTLMNVEPEKCNS